MQAAAMVLRARLRQFWKSWLALSLLVAVVGGLVLAAASSGRRTAAAFPRFVARHGYDALVYGAPPLSRLAGRLDGAEVTQALLPFPAPPSCASCRRPIDFSDFGIFEVAPSSLPRMVQLLSGRMPDQANPHEVLASYTLARDNGVRLGTVIKVPMFARQQAQALNNSAKRPPRPAGPQLTLRVVGFVVTQNEFPAGSGVRYDLFPTAAFARAVNPQVPVLRADFIRLRGGAAAVPALDSKLQPMHVLGVDGLDIDAATVQRGLRPQAVGWWVLAGLAALAGLAVIGQALARQSAAEGADHGALTALGLRSREFVLVSMIRAIIVGAVGPWGRGGGGRAAAGDGALPADPGGGGPAGGPREPSLRPAGLPAQCRADGGRGGRAGTLARHTPGPGAARECPAAGRTSRAGQRCRCGRCTA
jgi:hypothetical protein